MNTMIGNDQKYSQVWNIRYAMRFGRRQSAFLDTVARCMKILLLLAGTAAFAGVVGDAKEFIKWSGLAVGLLAIIDALWNPAALAAKSRELQARYALLNRDAPLLTPEKLQREMDGLHDPEVPEVKSLRPIAYNDTVSELGNPASEKFPLTFCQKCIEKLA